MPEQGSRGGEPRKSLPGLFFQGFAPGPGSEKAGVRLPGSRSAPELLLSFGKGEEGLGAPGVDPKG